MVAGNVWLQSFHVSRPCLPQAGSCGLSRVPQWRLCPLGAGSGCLRHPPTGSPGCSAAVGCAGQAGGSLAFSPVRGRRVGSELLRPEGEVRSDKRGLKRLLPRPWPRRCWGGAGGQWVGAHRGLSGFPAFLPRSSGAGGELGDGQARRKADQGCGRIFCVTCIPLRWRTRDGRGRTERGEGMGLLPRDTESVCLTSAESPLRSLGET